MHIHDVTDVSVSSSGVSSSMRRLYCSCPSIVCSNWERPLCVCSDPGSWVVWTHEAEWRLHPLLLLLSVVSTRLQTRWCDGSIFILFLQC